MFDQKQSENKEKTPEGTEGVCVTKSATAGSRDVLAEMLLDDEWRMAVDSRFWVKVARLTDWDSCWLWNGARKQSSRDSYGHFKLKSYTTAAAHRVSYALYYMQSPADKLVCHKCDNPRCVNPSHLFLGTVADNHADMMKKGRWKSADQKGENNGAAKLKAADVEVIRSLIAKGMTNVAIAPQFGVTHQAISKIRRGHFWKTPDSIGIN